MLYDPLGKHKTVSVRLGNLNLKFLDLKARRGWWRRQGYVAMFLLEPYEVVVRWNLYVCKENGTVCLGLKQGLQKHLQSEKMEMRSHAVLLYIWILCSSLKSQVQAAAGTLIEFPISVGVHQGSAIFLCCSHGCHFYRSLSRGRCSTKVT